MNRIYMDANATTPLTAEVVEAMRPFWIEDFANASSIHQDGQRAHHALTRARASVAQLVGCSESELVFTSGGTEANNTALQGLLRPGDHLITTSMEHSAILQPARRLAERSGVELTLVDPLPSGRVDPAAIRAALRPNTRLISMMLANNETGVLQPAAEVGQIACEAGVYFHIDAVQAAGKIPLQVEELNCHLLSISAHKMHGPKGTGALYVRKQTPLEALILGGSHERRRRAGTENVPAIVGFGKAAELALALLNSPSLPRLAALRNHLEAALLALGGVSANGRTEPRTANTTNLTFHSIDAEDLLIALDLAGIAVSGGSACHSGATQPSHVLLAMGLSPQDARSSLRFSLLKTASESEVDQVAETVGKALARLR